MPLGFVSLVLGALYQSTTAQSTRTYGAFPAGNLVLLFIYIRGVVLSKGKRFLSVLYSFAALVVWFLLGAGLAFLLERNYGFSREILAHIFGATFLIPMWFGTMFTRTPKKG